MANFLELVNGLSGHSVDQALAGPGVSLTMSEMPARGANNQAPDGSPEFPSSEHDNLFAHDSLFAPQGIAASTHHQPSLPSFPEAFGGPNDCHREPFSSSLCPLRGDFLQIHQQYRLPQFPPPSPAHNIPRALGWTTTSNNSDSHNNSHSPCQTRVSETPALQWPEGALADRPFSYLSHAPPLHSQQLQQQHPQPFDNHPVNPHSFITTTSLGGLDLDGLDWDLDLHHTHRCTTQQPPPSASQVPLPRPVSSPTTTAAPSTARLDHEYAPFSNQAPPFSTTEQLRHHQLLPLPPPQFQPQPQPPSALLADQLVDTLQAQIPGADFDHFSAPYGSDHNPFPFWRPSMTSAPAFNPDPFEPDTTMPSIANPPSARRRSSRRLSNSVVDLTKEESRDNLTSSSPVPMAPPPSRKRRRSTTSGGGTSASNARRNSASQASKAIKTEAKRPGSRGGDTCVFGSSSPPAFQTDEDVLDLTEANEVPTDQKKVEVDRRVKLSKFQCVICMDDVSNLTVTHCGHLFCSECLHSALHIDSSKKSCPVCRTKVELRSKTGKNTKSYYHLELKVMTATRKGKQPAAATR